MKHLIFSYLLTTLITLAACDEFKTATNQAEMVSAPNDMVGNPTTVNNIEVAQYDLPGIMTHAEAKVESEKIGNGWRLPTLAELKMLYQNKDQIQNFAVWYWALEDETGDPWRVSLVNGLYVVGNENGKYNVRLVRDRH